PLNPCSGAKTFLISRFLVHRESTRWVWDKGLVSLKITLVWLATSATFFPDRSGRYSTVRLPATIIGGSTFPVRPSAAEFWSMLPDLGWFPQVESIKTNNKTVFLRTKKIAIT